MTPEVVLCTCDGAAYVDQQLESLCAQTSWPVRVLVFDDVSLDDSVALVEAFASRVPLQMQRNLDRVGPVRNYEQGLKASAGDPVLLCDQDDVWHPNKVERLVQALVASPDSLLAFSDARLMDSRGAPLGRRLSDALGGRAFADTRSTAFLNALLKRNLVTGATVAVRRELINLALPIPQGWWHDEWLAIIAAALDSVAWVPEPLIDYRIHDKNTLGLRRVGARAMFVGAVQGGRDHHVWKAHRLEQLLQRLRLLGPRVPQERLTLVEQAVDFWRFRAALPSSRLPRASAIWRQFRHGEYHRFAAGARSAVRDLV